MYTRALPPNHPRAILDGSPTDTSVRPVASVNTGSQPAPLSIPINQINMDGGKIPIYLSGRVVLYTGATPGGFVLNIYNGSQFDISHRIAMVSTPLPASASGYVMPFMLNVQAVYDVEAGLLYGVYRGRIDPANNRYFQGQPFSLPVVVSPDALNFCACYGFSVAPLSGTQVQIARFTFG